LGTVRNIGPGAVRLFAALLVFTLLLGLFYNLSTLPLRKEMAVLARHAGQRIIVLDPGHGGFDGGARGLSGVEEEEIVLAVAKDLAWYLEQAGARVFLTREEDVELAEDKVEDLNARIRLAEAVAADLFLSIHANSFPSPYEYGAQSFYCHNHPASETLAKEIQGALVEGIDILGYNYREAQEAEYYLLRNLEIPAALIEIGFLSNPREEALLSQRAYQKRLAWCLFVGVVRFFSRTASVEETGY